MQKKVFKKVAIIGVGLIGGSIGLAIKKKRLADEVIGVFRRPATLRRALRRKAIDRGVLQLEEGVRDADLIIIATPVSLIPAMAERTIAAAKPGAIITDVGSTKKWVVASLERMLGNDRSFSFVGSHPMAGSDQTGVEAARADLLAGAPCIVTKTRRTNTVACAKISAFWRALGAVVSVMSPDEHDHAVSFISHLPHLVAYSVAGVAPRAALRLAAEGFKDTTRVASSDPVLWADIFFTNKRALTTTARRFERYYHKLLTLLADNDYKGVVALLAGAKAKRDSIRCHGPAA